jgi:multicomponent Na+:H+ antiporter subunit B
VRRVVEILAILVVALFLVGALSDPGTGQTPLRDLVVTRAVSDTGSINLVTAIYLGYRAYDTLGETIVLLMAVAGVTILVRRER